MKKVDALDDLNEMFFRNFNIYVETEHENEISYVAFRKGVTQTFKPKELVDFIVDDHT